MNRAQAKRHIKATTYTELRGCRPYRKRSKAEESANIQRQMTEFYEKGGEIQKLDTQESRFRPTWQAYAVGAYEDRGHEA